MARVFSPVAACVALMFLAAACTPAQQAYKRAAHQPYLTDEVLVAGDGHTLPLRYWLPEDATPIAIIIALHGFNDYSNAFSAPGEYLSHHGIAVYAYDQRGFGKTPYHGIWAGQENLMQDVEQMVRAVADLHPGIPIYLLGESMGGAVVITTLAERPLPQVKGAILTAPAVWGDETMNILYRASLWTMAHTLPQMELTGKGLKILASDNIEMLRALSRDPLIIKRTRVDAIYGIVKLMDAAYRDIGRVNTPLLLLYGANDQVIPKAPVRQAIEHLHAPQRIAYYPDGYHMLLRDLGGEVVLGDIQSWIEHPDAPLPSGYDADWEKRMEN